MGAREGKSEGVQKWGDPKRQSGLVRGDSDWGHRRVQLGHLKGLAAGGGPVGTLNAVREWSSWLQVGSC